MNRLLAIIMVLTGVLVASCVTVPRVAPLSVADVIGLAKAGTADADIIQRIDQTYSVFRLTAADVVRLKTEGVSEAVIDHMLATYTRWAVARERYYHYWGPPPHPRFLGPPPW